jgi:hypothetical protein
MSKIITPVSATVSIKAPVRLAFLLVLAWVAYGCSPSEPKPKSPVEIQDALQKRKKWRQATLVGEYDRAGRKNPKWDEDVRTGLDSFADIDLEDAAEGQKDWERVGRYVDSAVGAGCDDPLVKYFYLRTTFAGESHATNEIVDAYSRMAMDIENSGYCDVRKFWGSLRAAQEIKRADWTSRAIYGFRRQAMAHIGPALDDKDLPPKEALDACRELLATTEPNPQEFPDAYKEIEGRLFKNFSKTAVPYAIKGYYYVDYAWKARGTGLADSVTKEGGKLFAERLDTAASALEKAWRMDPTEPLIPNKMITVELGQGKGRDRMELWFQRAMKADSNNVTACKSKMNYLQPKWYGSYQDMIDFGHQCLTNQAWGGFVTDFIVDVHQAIADSSGERANYWKRPGVWEDVHAGFEEFFRRNPDAVAPHYNYTWYAWNCGAWDVVAQQLPLLSQPINYNYFGGRESFDEMRKYAEQYSKTSTNQVPTSK